MHLVFKSLCVWYNHWFIQNLLEKQYFVNLTWYYDVYFNSIFLIFSCPNMHVWPRMSEFQIFECTLFKTSHCGLKYNEGLLIFTIAWFHTSAKKVFQLKEEVNVMHVYKLWHKTNQVKSQHMNFVLHPPCSSNYVIHHNVLKVMEFCKSLSKHLVIHLMCLCYRVVPPCINIQFSALPVLSYFPWMLLILTVTTVEIFLIITKFRLELKLTQFWGELWRL